MKKSIFTLLLMLISTFSYSQAPAIARQFTFTTATTSAWIGAYGSGVSLYRVQYQPVNGTPSACAFTVQGSNDQSNTTTLLTVTDCTAAGSTSFVSGDFGYIRVNVTSLALS